MKEAKDLRIGKGISGITVDVSKDWLVAGLGYRQATSHPLAARLQDGCLATRWLSAYKMAVLLQDSYLATRRLPGYRWLPGYKMAAWLQDSDLATRELPGYKIAARLQNGCLATR